MVIIKSSILKTQKLCIKPNSYISWILIQILSTETGTKKGIRIKRYFKFDFMIKYSSGIGISYRTLNMVHWNPYKAFVCVNIVINLCCLLLISPYKKHNSSDSKVFWFIYNQNMQNRTLISKIPLNTQISIMLCQLLVYI